VTTAHGVLCACDVCDMNEENDYWTWQIEQDGKAIARAADFDHISTCD
jgi:hypothetical protein